MEVAGTFPLIKAGHNPLNYKAYFHGLNKLNQQHSFETVIEIRGDFRNAKFL